MVESQWGFGRELLEVSRSHKRASRESVDLSKKSVASQYRVSRESVEVSRKSVESR